VGERLTVALEGTGKKVFASALEWPGWSRVGKSPDAAIEHLLGYAPRFEPVARAAGLTLASSFDVDVVERLDGGSGTDFGVPSSPAEADSRPTSATDAARLASIVEAAWGEFDRVVTSAPAELRKGPRGGGRDRDKIAGHVSESDWYYAREMGIRERQPAAGDRAAVEVLRTAMLQIVGRPSDGRPLADRKWPVRYAARRIAWHALDHAWEIEDRSE
jgi:hypothetical protein